MTCHRVRAQAKIASRKNLQDEGESVFVQFAQTVDASRENGCWYDEVVSGPKYYNYFRDYDPATGRFPQSDPLGLKAGQFSTYTYVHGNPLIYYDPFGLAIGTPDLCANPENAASCQAAEMGPTRPKPAVPLPIIPSKPEHRKKSWWDVIVQACHPKGESWPSFPPDPPRRPPRNCAAECAHLLPSPSGDLQSSEYRQCYRQCMGTL